jgi:predicted HicB family RNase H-like nuclease
MGREPKSTSSATVFPLRLPQSTRRMAVDIAIAEGLSLNQFIALAVAEKIVRMETGGDPEH